jgi:hypothetical protein
LSALEAYASFPKLLIFVMMSVLALASRCWGEGT